MGLEEILFVAWSGNFNKERLILLLYGEKCKVLKKGNGTEIAEYVANNYPLSYEDPELKTGLCEDCPCGNCHTKYVPLDNSELQSLIEMIFHIQEGDEELVNEIRQEEKIFKQ